MDQPNSGCKLGAAAVLNMEHSSSLSISYHHLFGPHEDLILLELDEKLLPDILHHGVSLRGEPDEDAVLCSRSKTYAVKFVGTSNSVFLIPPSDKFAPHEIPNVSDEKNLENMGSASVIKVARGNMEIVEVAPKLDKVKLLLSENPYRMGEDSEMDEANSTGGPTLRKGLYRWEDLINKVQASDEELRSALQAFQAVKIDRYWRIVDEKYMEGVLKVLLSNSVLNDWAFNALSEDEVVETLQSDGFPTKLAEHCLQVYGTKMNVCEGGRRAWTLDERRVCVHFARRILKEEGKMKVERFTEEWNLKVPHGMRANLEMLEGEVLMEKLGLQSWIYWFSVSSLPCDPGNRFSSLFRERAKWEWKDLQPYIRDLRVPGLSSEGLLLKYTRRTQSTPDAEPVFTPR